MSIENHYTCLQEQNENLDEKNEVQEGYNETDLEGIDTAQLQPQDFQSNA